MLIKDPQKRISWEEIFNHELVQGGDLIHTYNEDNVKNSPVNFLERKKSDRGFKMIMLERSKIGYLYNILMEIVSNG